MNVVLFIELLLISRKIVDGFLPSIWAIVLIDKCSTLKQWSIKNRSFLVNCLYTFIVSPRSVLGGTFLLNINKKCTPLDYILGVALNMSIWENPN